jgi:hypothetical protein
VGKGVKLSEVLGRTKDDSRKRFTAPKPAKDFRELWDFNLTK